MNNDDAIQLFLDWSKKILGQAGDQLKEWCNQTLEAEFDCNLGKAFGLAAGIAFLLGSGFWAASIAMSRRQNPYLHFLLGLVIPWIYPMIILFTMEIKGDRELREKLLAQQKAKEEKEAEARRKEEMKRQAELAAGTVVEESAFGEAYFTRIQRKPDGTPAGPWNVMYDDARILVLEIVEVLPEVVCVNFQDARGNASRMRIPYKKIQVWEEAKEL